MPLSKSAFNTFCGFKDVSSVFSFPCHPSRRGWVKLGSLAVASWRKDTWPKSQLSGSSVLNTEWQIGTLLTMSVQSVLLSIFQETSVCNSCTESTDSLWVTPCHPKCQVMRAHLRYSQVGKLLLLTAWHVTDVCLTRVPQQRPQAG